MRRMLRVGSIEDNGDHGEICTGHRLLLGRAHGHVRGPEHHDAVHRRHMGICESASSAHGTEPCAALPFLLLTNTNHHSE